MSEHENELKKALAENGDFDAEKAKHDAEKASRWFDSRLKWSGRFAWMRIILVLLCLNSLSSNLRRRHHKGHDRLCRHDGDDLILVGVIGVQSWVAGTKISVLKEIKLLRLECLGRPTEQVLRLPWEHFQRSLPRGAPFPCGSTSPGFWP